MEKTVKELKNALDISWDRHKEEYEKKGWDKEYFYSAALSQINSLNKINGIDIQSLEKELGFITREYNYRSNLSEAIINNDYIALLYNDAIKDDVQVVGYFPDSNSMIKDILDKINEMEQSLSKRSFIKESKYIDSFLIGLSAEKRYELLRRIISQDKSFNIHFISKKFEGLYDFDLDNLKLLLAENAYRISVIMSEGSAIKNIDMLSTLKTKDSVYEYERNGNILNDIIKDVHDVPTFISNLSAENLNSLARIYAISLDNRVNKNYIYMANTINPAYEDRIEVFKQFESLETIDKIKNTNKKTY